MGKHLVLGRREVVGAKTAEMRYMSSFILKTSPWVALPAGQYRRVRHGFQPRKQTGEQRFLDLVIDLVRDFDMFTRHTQSAEHGFLVQRQSSTSRNHKFPGGGVVNLTKPVAYRVDKVRAPDIHQSLHTHLSSSSLLIVGKSISQRSQSFLGGSIANTFLLLQKTDKK